MEVWKSIEEFPNYVISPEGMVLRKENDRPKGTRVNPQGDLIIDLNRDDKRHTRKVSLLVAKAYLGEPRNESFNSVIHHDGNKLNCNANNLSWRPRWFVVRYNRMFDERPKNVSVMVEQTGEIFGTLRECCIKYGMVEDDAFVNMLNGDSCFPTGYRLQMV